MDATLHRAPRDAQPLADLLVGQILEEPEPKHFPQSGRERREGGGEMIARFPELDGAAGIGTGIGGPPLEFAFVGTQPLSLADPGTVAVDAVVARHRVQPDDEVGARVETVEPLVEVYDDLLGELLGLLVAPGEPVSNREQALPMATDEIAPTGVRIELARAEGADRGEVERVRILARIRGDSRPPGSGGVAQVSGTSGRPAATHAVYQRLAASPAALLSSEFTSGPSSRHMLSM